MTGNNYFNRTAQQQFKALDADTKRTLHTAYTEEQKEIEWKTKTVYNKKKNQRIVQVSFDTKLKWYTALDSNTIAPENEAIKVHLGDTFIHYRYHPDRKIHIHILDPPRSEASAKYVTTAQNCYLIKGRDIIMCTLLAYMVQKAGTTVTNLQNMN